MTCLDRYPLGKLENLLVPPDYRMGLFTSPENPSPLINPIVIQQTVCLLFELNVCHTHAGLFYILHT